VRHDGVVERCARLGYFPACLDYLDIQHHPVLDFIPAGKKVVKKAYFVGFDLAHIAYPPEVQPYHGDIAGRGFGRRFQYRPVAAEYNQKIAYII